MTKKKNESAQTKKNIKRHNNKKEDKIKLSDNIKGNGKKQRLFNLIRLPFHLLKRLSVIISEKLEFSIRFRLSLSYLKIFLRAMILAGLGIILCFGILKVYDTVSANYNVLTKVLGTDNIEYTEITEYSAEHNVPVLIYDYADRLMFESEAGLAEHGYKRTIGIVQTDENLYFAVNRRATDDGIPVRVVFYSDIREEIAEVWYLSRISLIVFSVIIFFSVISIALLGRGFFQPIKEMTQTVKDISERNLNLRLNVSGSKNELKELALTFNEMMNRIEDYYERQKQFVSDASHELRTPIAVIQGYTDMLDRWGKDDRAVLQESIDAIKNESENMKELIDKLLFLARHDKDTFVLQKEEFSLTEMLQEIIKETQIIDSSHQIVFDIDSEQTILADRNRMKQAIRIFIDNALKYTPSDGEIKISLEKEADNIAVSIKDNGIGMTREELGHIFDRFYRSEQSRTKDKGGHGLGLAIAKIIIVGHGGKIRVRSKAGEGSQFTILLKP